MPSRRLWRLDTPLVLLHQCINIVIGFLSCRIISTSFCFLLHVFWLQNCFLNCMFHIVNWGCSATSAVVACDCTCVTGTNLTVCNIILKGAHGILAAHWNAISGPSKSTMPVYFSKFAILDSPFC